MLEAPALIDSIAEKHGLAADAIRAVVGEFDDADGAAKRAADSAAYWETSLQEQLDAVSTIGESELLRRLHDANKLARDSKIELLDAATLIAHGGDGRAYRWSRLALDLDDRQKAAVDRAIKEAEKTGERGDAEVLKAVADALKADGFDDHLTTDGFLRIKVRAARTGVQLYSDGVETWGELRTEDEVGDPESIDSWGLKPVTDDHPPVLVVPRNYKQFAVGGCGQDAALTKALEDGNRYIELTILVGDLAALIKIRDGKLELSAGYTAVMVADAGVWTDGTEYRYRQTKIRINHLAIVEAGRAGPLACISLDGSAYEVARTTTHQQDTAMKLSKDSLSFVRVLLTDTAATLDSVDQADADPEVVELLVAAIKSALTGGAMPDDLKAKLMALLELTPEGVEEMGEGEPEDQEAVELGDGLTVQLSKDDAEKWRKIKAAADTKIAELQDAAKKGTEMASEVNDAKTNNDALSKELADLKGENIAIKRQLDRLTEAKDVADRKALISDVKQLCPALAKKWEADSKAGKSLPAITDMRAAVVVDLDPGAKVELDRERDDNKDTPQIFDAFVASLFRSTVRAATDRRDAQHNDGSEGQAPKTSWDSIKKQVAQAAYGVA